MRSRAEPRHGRLGARPGTRPTSSRRGRPGRRGGIRPRTCSTSPGTSFLASSSRRRRTSTGSRRASSWSAASPKPAGSGWSVCGSGYEYDWSYGYCTEGLTPCVPDTVYGACKHALHEMVRSYAAARQLSVAWPRVFFLYGPHEHPQRLVSSVVRALLRGEPAPCSHGRQIRDYMHVQDVADGLVARPRHRRAGRGQRVLGPGHDPAGDRAHIGAPHRPARTRPARRPSRPRQRRSAGGGRQRAPQASWAGSPGTTSSPGCGRPSIGGGSRRTREGDGSTMSEICVLGTGMAGYGAAYGLREAGRRPSSSTRTPITAAIPPPSSTRASTPSTRGRTSPSPRTSGSGRSWPTAVDQQVQALPTKVNNYWKGHWIKHPAQVNLHGLPPDLMVRSSATSSRRSSARRPRSGTTRSGCARASGTPSPRPSRCSTPSSSTPRPAANMSTDWIGPRLYQAKLEEILRGALMPSTPDVHYIDGFRYPTHGGFVSYLRRFMEDADLRLGHKVVAHRPEAPELRFANGAVSRYAASSPRCPCPDLDPDDRRAPRRTSSRPRPAGLHRARHRQPGRGSRRPHRRALDLLLRPRHLLHPSQHPPPAVAPQCPPGLREPPGGVLLLAEVPSARPQARRLHRAGHPRPAAGAGCCGTGIASSSRTRCTSSTPT